MNQHRLGNKVNDIQETTCVKKSCLHSIIFLLLLTYVILRNSNIFQLAVVKDKIQNENKELDFEGSECAYNVILEKPVKIWQKTKIHIKYNVENKCSEEMKKRLLQKGGSVFRIHAYSVYEMVTATSTYIGNQTYLAELLLTFPTKYVVMVMLTYVNGLALDEKQHVTPLLKQLHHSPFSINVIRSKKQPSNLARYCKKKESGKSHGRWVKCGGSINGLERCGPWQSSEFDFDNIHSFRWVPYKCQYHQYTNDQIKRCFAKNGWDSIVFAGDSHMRYRAYHWVTRLYGNCHACVKTHIKMVFDKVPRIEWIFDARGTRLPLTFPNVSLPYEKYIHPNVRRSKFSQPFPQDAIESNLLLFNFGHWILREINDIQFLREKVRAYAEAAKILQHQGKTVIWVNTVSLPWRTDKSVIEWRENTSPYRVRAFNRITDDIMTKYGIPVVDAFSISDGRIAATHDQTHYTKKLPGNDFGGVVENAISNSIFNLLCNNN